MVSFGKLSTVKLSRNDWIPAGACPRMLESGGGNDGKKYVANF